MFLDFCQQKNFCISEKKRFVSPKKASVSPQKSLLHPNISKAPSRNVVSLKKHFVPQKMAPTREAQGGGATFEVSRPSACLQWPGCPVKL